MEKLIRFDWAIKKLLRNKANFDILEGFLSALLNDDITVVNLLESESNQEDESDKFNRVDLLVENDKHELIIIEVQVKSEEDFFHRIAYSTSKLLSEHLEKGQPYRNIKKVISISITYFDLGFGTDYLYYGSTNFFGTHSKDALELTEVHQELFDIDEVRKVFPEYYLIQVGKFADKIQGDIDEWIYMLKHSEVKPEFEATNIQQASEKLRIMHLAEKQKKAYEHFIQDLSYEQSMLWSSQQEGKREGIKKGKQEEKLAVVRNALQQGLESTIISTITGLSVEEIQKIQEMEYNE
jgi:predicted transposase/invertase (TIGR01784 family)